MSVGAVYHHKKKILFVVNEAGEFIELRRVALAAKWQGYEIHFLFAQPGYINLFRDRAFCHLEDFKDYFPGKRFKLSSREKVYRDKAEMLHDGYSPNSLLELDKPRSVTFSLVVLGLSLILQYPFMIVDRLGRLWERAKQYSEANKAKPFSYGKLLFHYLQPDLIVFGQEFPGSVNALLTKLCNKQGVPTLIIPFAVGTTKEMVESLADKPDYEVDKSLLNRMVAFLFPHWVNYYAGKRLLRLPGKTVMILEALGLAPEHPWLPNNSRVTRIAVESPEMVRYHRRMRFPESQLRLTGAAYDDVLAETRQSAHELKQNLCRRLSVNPEKPLLVCAWPTNQFGSRFIPLEFNSYEQLCHAWAKALVFIARKTDFNVIIRPHPVTDAEFLVNILRPYRLHYRITDIDTLKLVPVCDLFVACVSSTLRWAIACGIPAINYDCYNYGYTDFNPAKGLTTVKKYVDFEHVLQRLTEDSGAYAESRRLQVECSTDWGIHDGQSMKRILKLIADLTEHSTTP